MADSQPYYFSDVVPSRPVSRPAALICLSTMCGIAYARYFPVNLSVLLLLLLLFVSSWFVYTRNHDHTNPNTSFHWAMVLCLAFLLGTLRMEMHWLQRRQITDEVKKIAAYENQIISGRIEELYLRDSDFSYAILCDVQTENDHCLRIFPGKIGLSGPTSLFSSFHTNAQLQFSGELLPVQGPKVPTGHDYQEFLFSKGIYASVNLDNRQEIRMLPSTSTFRLNRLRDEAHEALQRTRLLLPHVSLFKNHAREDIEGLISSVCFGLRSSVSSTLNNILYTSGLAHLTSISGLHVTLVLVLTAMWLKKFGLRRRQAAGVTFILGFFYLFFVGARIPAIRATLMAFVVLGHYFTERRVDSLNSLALAALLILAIQPGQMFLPSFQLSFAAVLLLILYGPLWQKINSLFRSTLSATIFNMTMASLLMVIGLAPFAVYYFHIFSWGTLFGNLFAIPVVSLLLPTTYMWYLTTYLPFPGLADIIGYLPALFSHSLFVIMQFFSKSIFRMIIPFPGLLVSIFWFCAILVLANPTQQYIRFKNHCLRAYHLAFFLFALSISIYLAQPAFQPLRVDFLGLGQGDCTVIRTANHHTILVDGGPPERNRRNLFPALVDYLLFEGVTKIDLMILSHPQADHIGEFESVIHLIPVSLILEGSVDVNIQTYRSFVQEAENKGIPRKTVRAGDRIPLDDETNLWILHPDEQSLQSDNDINEASIVVLFQYRDVRLLLTGDIGKTTEKTLCERYDNWDIDILKVPHHGSRYSTTQTLLEETKPEFAVIQVGRNSYGHPHPDTCKRLSAFQTHVFRTDIDGTVRFLIDENRFRIYTTQSNRLHIYNE
ncbi:MAG: DNA internalization-related competence protein ComEC/Rec2 [Candidatus Omnitrophota bacterium]|jgi:competence protein ComEC|nr:MAG: DNA internalization-related competence protein ComEC/Rec2 [Candidatus Omnitrophota bacterium]